MTCLCVLYLARCCEDGQGSVDRSQALALAVRRSYCIAVKSQRDGTSQMQFRSKSGTGQRVVTFRPFESLSFHAASELVFFDLGSLAAGCLASRGVPPNTRLDSRVARTSIRSGRVAAIVDDSLGPAVASGLP